VRGYLATDVYNTGEWDGGKVVYQNGGFTPAWSVSQWRLAGRGAMTGGLRG